MNRFVSYKLRFHETHVRAVPTHDESGLAFKGPGVDLRGAEATAILELAGPYRAWVEEREPGVVLRSLIADTVKGRVILTLEPMTPEQRPRVLRIDPPHGDQVMALAHELESRLATACFAILKARQPVIYLTRL